VIEQHARVVAVDGRDLEVELGPGPACGLCGRQRGCAQALLNRAGAASRVRVPIPPQALVRAGDRITLGLPEHRLLRASLRLYLVPLLLAWFGAMLGSWLAPWAGAAPGFALLGLAAGWYWNRRRDADPRSRRDYQPRVLAITREPDSSFILREAQ